jgi:ATP-dependent exoDNAse (exonuclease V) beta subunit
MSKPFTQNQSLASTLLDRPISVMASAGSGKTSTLVERYVNLLKAGYSPREILTVTFTKEAAGQLRDRISERLFELNLNSEWIEEVESSRSIGTIHSLCYSVINQFGDELGLPPVREVIDDFTFLGVFSKAYQQWLDELPPETLDQLLDYFPHRELRELARTLFLKRNLFFDCLALAQDSGGKDPGAKVMLLLERALSPLFNSLSARFHSSGQYSFDDLENLCFRILQVSTLARTRLTQQYRQILLDEFQDTSPLQWQILRILIGDLPQKLFMVGDPKQSIYGFRQAEPALFEEVSNLILHQNGSRLELIHNFRSNRTLLESINFLSQRLFEEQPFAWSPMLPGLSEGKVSSRPFHLHWYGPAEKTTRKELQNQEVSAVVSQIERLIKKGISLGEITVLFRNSDRILEFSEAFRAKGWDYRCKQTDSLSSQLDILDLISYLQALADPFNELALVSFLRSRYVDLSYQEILDLTQKREFKEGKYEALVFTLLKERPAALSWFLDLLEKGETKLEVCLEKLVSTGKYFPQSLDALDAILKPLSRPGIELFEIEQDLQIWRESELFFTKETQTHDPSQGIQLMTVHSSKGLEFDYVFLVDALRQLPQDLPPLLLKAGLPPGIRYWDGDEKVMSASYQGILDEMRKKDEEEARRILYVAATRAKKELHFFSARPEAISYPKNSWAALLTSAAEEAIKLDSNQKEEETPGSASLPLFS